MTLAPAVFDVQDFHHACEVPVHNTVRIPHPSRIKLRMRLIDEEAGETSSALDKMAAHASGTITLAASDLDDTIVEIADGLADTIYVCIGAALEFGIPLAEVWRRVQEANMAKVDPKTRKVRKREDGKILKPDGWKEPDVLGALTLYGWKP